MTNRLVATIMSRITAYSPQPRKFTRRCSVAFHCKIIKPDNGFILVNVMKKAAEILCQPFEVPAIHLGFVKKSRKSRMYFLVMVDNKNTISERFSQPFTTTYSQR